MVRKNFIPVQLLFFCLLLSSGIMAQRDSTIKRFYPKGRLRSVQHEGVFNGCAMPVGIDTFFYRSGKISGTIFYDNRKSNTAEGCHEGWTIEIRRTFYENGRIKTISQKKYSYEGTPCNCGSWWWKDAKGKITRKKNYGECYDQVSCN